MFELSTIRSIFPQDVNEFSPVLDIPDLTFSVVETRAVGSVLTQIAATDQDNPVGNLVSTL